MKKFKITTLAFLMAFGAFAQSKNWAVDHSHTSVNFSVEHLVISEVQGQFKDFSGSATTTGADFSNATINFTIKTASVFTDDEKRDAHLQNADFFDATKFPEITFKSTSFKKIDEKNYTLTGSLTLHGVTKTVDFKVKYNGTITDPYGKTRAGFKLTGKINRKDFGVGSSMPATMIGEEIQLVSNVEAVQQ